MGTLFDGKSLAIVTGTTRGLGQEIVKQFSQNLQEGSHLVLVSKSSELTGKTEALKKEFPKLVYYAFNCDLSNLEEVMKLCDNLVSGFGEDLLGSVDNLAIVHNSGSIGQIDKGCEDLTDGYRLQSYTNLNFNSMVLLNAAFIRLKKKSTNKDLRSWVVNISSLAAVLPINNLTEYCSIKSAREMCARVLCLENPDVRTLSYAPGPMETEMNQTLRSQWPQGEDVKNWNFILPSKSIGILLDTLRQNKFENGGRLDALDGGRTKCPNPKYPSPKYPNPKYPKSQNTQGQNTQGQNT